MRPIRAATLPVSLWPNGAGRKADIAEGEDWLLSLAWLDADAPFSSLPGIDRTITLVQGPGFTLDIAGRPPLVGQTRFAPQAFDGGAPTRCRIAGPSRVLNVMTARATVRHAVAITGEPTGPMPDTDAPLARFCVVLDGAVTVQHGGASVTLDVLDAIQLDAQAAVAPAPRAVFAMITLDRAIEPE